MAETLSADQTLSKAAAAPTPTKSVDMDNPLADMRVKYFLHRVFEQTGRRPRDLALDIFRGYFGERKVNASEYFAMRLFDPALSREARDAFVGLKAGTRINRRLNWNAIHHGAIDTKTMLAALLIGYGLRAPDTQAIASATQRHPQRTLSTPEALAAFLRTDARYPLFGKPVASSQSMGVASIEGYDAETDRVLLKSVGPRQVETFAAEIFETFPDDSYLLQTRIAPHPELARLAGDALGTVRVVTLRDGQDVKTLYAVWKIPAVGAIADNFWRDGNMLAQIDIATGEARRVQLGSGVNAKLIETHPGTGQRLLGAVLPDWPETLAMAERAALAFPHTRIIGWDMGLTDQGPLVVEGNTNPNHGLFQTAAHEGLMAGARKTLIEAIIAENEETKKRRKETRKQKQRELKRRAISKAFKSVLADG